MAVSKMTNDLPEKKIIFDDFIDFYKLEKYKNDIEREFTLTKNGNVKKSDITKILNKFLIENNKKSLKDKAIDFGNRIFQYAEQTFSYIIVDGIIYFKAKEIAKFLCYKNTNDAICVHVSDEEKFTHEELMKKNKNLGGGESPPLNNRGRDSRPLTHNEKNTIYITEDGLYDLILSSKMEEAKNFRKFITKEILPVLRKTGSYSVHDEHINRHLITAGDLDYDTSSAKLFYIDTSVTNMNFFIVITK